MSLNLLKISGNINFLLIFPFYFTCQILIQNQKINPSPILSFSSIISTSIIISLIGLITSNEGRRFLTATYTKIYFSFLLLYTIFALYQYGIGIDFSFFEYHIKSIIRLIGVFLITIIFTLNKTLHKKKNISIILFLCILFSIQSLFQEKFIKAIAINDGFFELDYQMLGFLLFYVFIDFSSERKNIKLLLFLISILFTMFHTGARTEFYMGILFFATMIFLESRHKTVIFICTLILSIIFYNLLYQFDEMLRDVRMFSIFYNHNDASANSRSILTSDAINTISNHFFLGEFGSHELGAYAHNLLSAWVDFGFIGFLLLILLIIIPFIHLLFFSKKTTYLWRVTFAIFTILIIAFTVAKTYNYSLLSVALAYYVFYSKLAK